MEKQRKVENYQWHLKRSRILLGTLKLIDEDFPWFNCAFSSNPNFEDVRKVFDEHKESVDDCLKVNENSLANKINEELAKINDSLFQQRFYIEPAKANCSKINDDSGILLFIDKDFARFRISGLPNVGYKKPKSFSVLDRFNSLFKKQNKS